MPKKYVPVPARTFTCVICGRAFEGRRAGRKYCSNTCNVAAAVARETRSCTIDGCERKQHAKSLCKSHYNNQLPSRHKKIAVICECCGCTTYKEARQRRYKRSYCSELCRDYDLWGARSSKLPASHWVYMIGATCDWSPPRPKTFECAWCGAAGTVKGNRDTYCSDPCRFRSKRARRRAKEFGAHGTYTWGQVVGLWAMFGRACAYCRTPTALEDIQAEHVIALSKGGANNLGNLLPSCAPCNADKRDLTMDEWKADRERRELPPVITHWASNDPLYEHLAPMPHALAA